MVVDTDCCAAANNRTCSMSVNVTMQDCSSKAVRKDRDIHTNFPLQYVKSSWRSLWNSSNITLENGDPVPSLSVTTFLINFSSGDIMDHDVSHKSFQFVASHVSLSVCLIQLFPRTTPCLVMHKSVPVRSAWPTKIPWVMRLPTELTQSPPIVWNDVLTIGINSEFNKCGFFWKSVSTR